MTVGSLDMTQAMQVINSTGFNDISGSGIFTIDFYSLNNSSFTVGTNSSVELAMEHCGSERPLKVASASALANRSGGQHR